MKIQKILPKRRGTKGSYLINNRQYHIDKGLSKPTLKHVRCSEKTPNGNRCGHFIKFNPNNHEDNKVSKNLHKCRVALPESESLKDDQIDMMKTPQRQLINRGNSNSPPKASQKKLTVTVSPGSPFHGLENADSGASPEADASTVNQKKELQVVERTPGKAAKTEEKMVEPNETERAEKNKKT